MTPSRLAQVLWLTLLALPLGLAAEAGDLSGDPPHRVDTIQVMGSGRIELTPDRVLFTVGVDTTAAAVADAVRQNSERVGRVIDALKGAGAKAEDLKTSQLSISPQYEYQEGKRPRIIGYEVTNTVTVRHPASADVGRMLQATVDAGANRLGGIAFVVADPTVGQQEGLRRAFADARDKAEVLARAAGRTLGPAIAISEGGAAPLPPQPMMMRMQADAESVPVEPGTEERSFAVGVTFQLR